VDAARAVTPLRARVHLVSTALYRRYRPETFAEVIGQEHVTGPLSAALVKNRVNHAYLFSGPRGCGKTTSARILARCLNCEQGPTATPCGTCPSCLDLARNGSGSLDVVEIDAASHGGVDDARDLRERAAFAPVRDRYKIFIIDEAHMVSTQGFNALLKIVEEPPEHVRFIFATTEPEKVIGTIRSRTHHYPFRLVPPERLQAYLSELCEREGVGAGKGVLPLVVRAGAGSVRDSLSVLDQLIAGAGPDGLSYPVAVQLLGYTDAALLDDVVDALAAGDGAGVFGVVDRVIESGHDPRRFVEDLLERLRDLLVISAVGAGRSTTVHSVLRGLPDDQLARMEGQAARFGAADLSRQADVVNVALTEMTGATSPRLQLELLCARLLLPGADDAERGLRARLDRLERRVGVAVPGQDAERPAAQTAAAPAAPAARPPAPPSAPAQSPAPEEAPAARQDTARPDTAPPAPATSAAAAAATTSAGPPSPGPAAPGALDVETIRRRWPEVLDALSRMKRATWSLISPHAQVLDFDGDRLLLGFGTTGLVGQFTRGAHQEFLRQALIEVLGLDCRLEASAAGAAGSANAGRATAPAPAGARAPEAPAPAPPGPPAPEPPRDDVPPPEEAPPPDEPPPPDDEPPPPPDPGRRAARRPAREVRLPAEVPSRPDEPRLDDEEFEGIALVGAPVVEQLLGGRVIEERED